MKVLAFAIGIFLVLGIAVFAQNVTLVQPGLLPDNPFHFFQNFFEQLQLYFAFNPQDKANVHLQLAEKRLAEMNLALQENKTNLVHSLSEDYDNEINQTQTEIDNAHELGQNVTALAQHVAEETFKHQLVLQNVLSKVPDNAKPAIENAINVSSNGHDQAVESIFENRNITGTVNVTFTIDNQTFTQTFNITSVHGKSHITKIETSPLMTNDLLCTSSGGNVTVSSCCLSANDFPNNCLIGACSCSPDNSHTVKICQCPQDECWNGNRCVSSTATDAFCKAKEFTYCSQWATAGFDTTKMPSSQRFCCGDNTYANECKSLDWPSQVDGNVCRTVLGQSAQTSTSTSSSTSSSTTTSITMLSTTSTTQQQNAQNITNSSQS